MKFDDFQKPTVKMPAVTRDWLRRASTIPTEDDCAAACRNPEVFLRPAVRHMEAVHVPKEDEPKEDEPKEDEPMDILDEWIIDSR